MLVTVPPPAKKTKIQTMVHFEPELRKKVDEIAKANGRSMSHTVCYLLLKGIEALELAEDGNGGEK